MATNIKKYESLASETHLARLYSEVNTLDSDSCWNWTGSKVKDGYGAMVRQIDNKKFTIFVHRLSWTLQNGEIPDGMVVDHTCHTSDIDNCKGACEHRSCINPAHLRITTFAENLRIKRSNPHTQTNEETGVCHNKLHKWEVGSYTVWKSGKRTCNECRKAQIARKKASL
jgi:hypothetical protein